MTVRAFVLTLAAAAALTLPVQAQEGGEAEPKDDKAEALKQRVEFMTQRLQESLGLSEEQSGWLRDILGESMAARSAAEEETTKAIEAQLTPEQAQKFAEHRKAQEEARAQRRGPGQGRGPGSGRGPGAGGRMRGPRSVADQVAALDELLSLSDEQAAAIQAAIEKAAAAREEAGKKEGERIRSILTEEQAARYDEMQARRARGRDGDSD